MQEGARELIGKKYILYGASSSGQNMLHYMKNLQLKNDVLGICDSSENKWGISWNGYNIISPEDLIKTSEDIIIIITSVYINEIYTYLQTLGGGHLKIISSLAFKLSIHYDVMNDRANYLDAGIRECYKEQYLIWCGLMPELLWSDRNNHIMMQLILRRDSCTLIHSIPKTGNTTLTASLRMPNVIETLHAIYRNETEKNLFQRIMEICNCNIRIITGVRNPIERIISQIWQRIDKPYGYGDDCVPTVISDDIFDILPTGSQEQWFEAQMKTPFGIDVFNYSFDKEKGYTVIHENNVDLFLYRLDYLNGLEEEISKFLGVSNIKLVSSNEAKTKCYVLAYKEYLEDVKIDSNFFEKIINSKEMKHFFTDEECQHYREKWKTHIVNI